MHEVFLGVYVFGARRIGRKGWWMAAVLASGDGAVLSHRSAVRLWRLLPPAAEVIDVICPPGRVVRRKGICSHQSGVQDDEWLVRDGIPVTSPFRTIFDLAAVVKMRELFETDRQRDRILVAEGWRTMRITWRQLHEEPEAIAEDLRKALERAVA